MTQVNSEGAVHVYACATGNNVLNGAYVDDELVIMDRNGNFDGSDDAAGYVDIMIPGLSGRHLLSQFSQTLKRPGLAGEVLGNRLVSRPSVAAPPSLRMTADPAGKVSLEAFSPSGLRLIQLFADGKLYKVAKSDGKTGSLDVTPAEKAGYRSLTAVSIDDNGLVSAPVTLPQTPNQGSAKGRLFGLAVGIDRYPKCGETPDRSCDLSFAVADANRLAGALRQTRAYSVNKVTVLADEHASRDAIVAAIDDLVRDATADDTLVLSFAGHGVLDGSQLLLALSATDPEDVEHSSLSFKDLSEHLKASKARVVLFLDVCHAGSVDRSGMATNDAAVARLVTDSGASMVVFSASKGRQFSEETAEQSGGRFSVAVEKILSTERDKFDLNANGAISVSELYRGIKAMVVKDSEGRQTPWLSRNLMIGDFELF